MYPCYLEQKNYKYFSKLLEIHSKLLAPKIESLRIDLETLLYLVKYELKITNLIQDFWKAKISFLKKFSQTETYCFVHMNRL